MLNKDVMGSLLADYQKLLFYLGNAYGTDIPLPMWFKHFGKGENGANEAYHIGIFGKTGSGKSILAKMILPAYCQHKEMSIFILDPQGEFAKDFKDGTEFCGIVQKIGRDVEVYSLRNLALTGWDLFKKVLVNSGFLNHLGIFQDTNRIQAAYQIEKMLKGSIEDKKDHELLWNLFRRPYFDIIWAGLKDDEILSHIYTSLDLRNRVKAEVEGSDPNEKYKEWESIARLFAFEGKTNGITISKLVDKIDAENKLIIIDLSGEQASSNILWNETIKFIVIGQFLDLVGKKAEQKYRSGGLLNGLVVIDEAHRLAPRDSSENEDMEAVKNYLIDSVRTTRKYGLGWMFISQTLSSLHRDIINQIRIYLFGFGLGWGIERQALQEIIGGQQEAMTLYQRFRDPQSSLNNKEYSFMSIGPISPLSFSGSPLFFNAYDFPKEYRKKNEI
jgi:hypothetical protein